MGVVQGRQYEVPQGKWDELGKKAGPLRNQRMLDEGKPVAFHLIDPTRSSLLTLQVK
ncbi:MAG: hypothetical protein WAM72_12330 [Xanthobacteraceae bacterium]